MLVAGLDEVGWGPLAGPVVSVVYVIDEKSQSFMPSGVTDSKQVSKKAMESLFLPLVCCAVDIGMGVCSAKEIDTMTPKIALQECYRRALKELHRRPDMLYVDGTNKIEAWDWLQIVEPKADAKYKCVSAASIVAKVYRDRLMTELAKKFPAYGWERNFGYCSAEHEEAIEKHGLLMDPKDESRYLHRRSYCRRFL